MHLMNLLLLFAGLCFFGENGADWVFDGNTESTQELGQKNGLTGKERGKKRSQGSLPTV